MTQRRIACFVLAFSLVGFAQIDTTTLRKDSTAVPAAGAPPVPMDSAAHVPPQPVPTSPVAAPETLAVSTNPMPRLAPAEDGASRLSMEGSVSYGWRMGKLLDEEDRLTRQFKIVLVGKDNDSNEVNPIASGILYQIAGWWKATPSNHLGIGLGYGRFSEHPASSYSSDLSEDFFDQFLVTARYRHSFELTERWKLLGEASLGWNHVRIERVPLVAAHRSDSMIQFKQAQLEQIELLQRNMDADGLHGQLGLNLQWFFLPSWSLGVTSAASFDRIWFQQVAKARISDGSEDIRRSLSGSPWFWGIDLGFSLARDF